MKGENRSTRRKTSRRRVENQQQTQPTCDAGSGSRTRDTLVGGERYHHCANPALVLSHFEYCNSPLIGIGKTLNKKLEDANHYGLRTIMNLGRNINYESILRTADMNTLEHTRIEQALIIFYKCYKENGPSYLADLFEPRITPYNLRNTGLNVTQNSYNSKFRHNSYSFVISRIWNKLPPYVKTTPNLLSFRRKLKTLIFTGCQCKSCL